MPSKRDDQRVYHTVTFGVVISMIFLGFVLMVLPPLHAFHLAPHGTWGTIFRDLGLAILISGLVGTGYELFTRQAFLGDVEHKLEEVVSRRYEELDQVRMSGLKTIHQEKFYARVEEKFRDAKKSIRILQTWSGEFPSLGRSLKLAAERGCEIRILLLKPNSEAAKRRGADLGHGETQVKKFIENDLAILNTLYAGLAKKKDNLEVRLYEASAVIAIHGFDDTNFVGTYWCGRHSQEGPQYEVVGRVGSGSDDPFLWEIVSDHFEAIWEQAEEYEWPEPAMRRRTDRGGRSSPSGLPNGQVVTETQSETAQEERQHPQ
jgi:Domain of unknown function (DUF5919)